MMKIEIWSDVVCPFCYIGKRRFETALHNFEHKEEVDIQWHSFQLNPQMKSLPGMNIYQELAEKKGWTIDQAKELTKQVITVAKEEGLNYNFDEIIPANTFDAHRLIQLSATHQLQNEAEELLFSAYFVEGRNIEDLNTLRELGDKLGLPSAELDNLFESDAYASNVLENIKEANEIGVNGVPFFVIDRKYAISGAQASGVFLEVLEKRWNESNESMRFTDIVHANGEACTTDGSC